MPLRNIEMSRFEGDALSQLVGPRAIRMGCRTQTVLVCVVQDRCHIGVVINQMTNQETTLPVTQLSHSFFHTEH